MASRQVVIALGSNLGDRGRNVGWAVQQLMQSGIQVLRCSALYETAAAYVTNQPAFLNAAILASTPLAPRALLSTLKGIEAAAGRDLGGGPRYGPRPLDLDIVFTSDQPYQDDKLHIPHPRWHERDFVLRPISDLWYDSTDQDKHQHTQTNNTNTIKTNTTTSPQSPGVCLHHTLQPVVRKALDWAVNSHTASVTTEGVQGYGSAAGEASRGQGGKSIDQQGGVPQGDEIQGVTVGGVMRRVTPMGKKGRLVTWGERTLVMGILNITPDSFSDGGAYMAGAGGVQGVTVTASGGEGGVKVDAVVRMACDMVEQGADILDVGGQSTRPGATRLTVEEELLRVIPVMRALRSCRGLDGVLISVDTFYAEVARQAVQAGADIVNDVSGGHLDPNMRKQVAELGVPYIVMHMRGDPTTMQHTTNTQYHGGVAGEVGRELQATLDLAVMAGIPAWNIISDPGIGFSKTSDGNWDLMRGLRWPLREHELQGAFRHGAMLVGPSRKGFLAKVTGKQADPRGRDVATVAAVVACVEQGADIVRVHNIGYAVDGVKVADMIYRNTL